MLLACTPIQALLIPILLIVTPGVPPAAGSAPGAPAASCQLLGSCRGPARRGTGRVRGWHIIRQLKGKGAKQAVPVWVWDEVGV